MTLSSGLCISEDIAVRNNKASQPNDCLSLAFVLIVITWDLNPTPLITIHEAVEQQYAGPHLAFSESKYFYCRAKYLPLHTPDEVFHTHQ